jgi:hypothetical protein
MGGKGSGGARKNTGPKGVPYVVRSYRVPKEHLKACTAAIQKTLKKYREKCTTSN